ncbi:EamA family transporter [Haloferax namakaokahaiae]|uniref:EamA family transporter n=1 Tax=Haloferax namakaokahaiae TaxID=1748331 RepID=A0ABD5ZD47_9EURY
MDPGIFYSIFAAFVWGVYIFTLKRYFPEYSGAVITVVVNAFAILCYLPVAAVTYDPTTVPSLGELGPTGIGVILGTGAFVGIAFILFVDALDEGDVSYVAPINKLVPVFVLPIEILLLHQVLSPLQVAGVVVATVAVYIANYEGGDLLAPLARAARSRPAQLALASAAFYAASDVGKRVALQELGMPTSVFVPTLFAVAGLTVLPFALRDWTPIRGSVPKFLGAGALVALGEHVTSTAFGMVPASIASPIINTQAIVAVVLGGIILKESQFALRLVAALLAVTGVSLIAVGDLATLVAFIS